MSSIRRITFVVLATLGLTGLVILGAILMTMWPVRQIVDCGPTNPFVTPKSGDQAVFTGTFGWLGFTVVREHFWGLPAGGRRAVLIAHMGLHNSLFGQTYFIDGRRSTDWIARFIPIIDVGNCGRSRPVDKATLDLYMLHLRPPQNAVRVVGQVMQKDNHPATGTRCEVTGPAGHSATTTDAEGLFDFREMPAGHYSLRVNGCDESQNSRYQKCSTDSDLREGVIWGVELRSN